MISRILTRSAAKRKKMLPPKGVSDGSPHTVAPDVRIVPLLCGSFSRSLYEGGRPEDDEGVRRFFGALGEIAAREADRLVFVLGVDMAHMGRRYGDAFDASAGRNEMAEVEARDRARIDRIATSDARGFWDLVREREDDLKWCGSSPTCGMSVCPTRWP